MTIDQAIDIARQSNKTLRRQGWEHPDRIRIEGTVESKGGGELHWENGDRAPLLFVADLTASDWEVQ